MSNCIECDREMHSNKCACGWVVPDLPKPKPAWVPPQSYPSKKANDTYRRDWYAARGLPYQRAKLWHEMSLDKNWMPLGALIPPTGGRK